ncbi:zf-TFIIB domain-containing protein [Cohnella sp. GCM10020058]|uniref:TFIIB-type zinc ribbon-containing protein n=1 Tax=Cohnella sp. GCM10020058 TaxID=3317330 RepID=UPI00362648BC
MNCPICEDSRMREVEKNGIMIDVCPNCKGVWLDRGELDKLMTDVREVRTAYNEWHYRDDDDDDRKRYAQQSNDPPHQSYDSHQQPYGKHNSDYYKKKKKKSVLDVFGDLFD